MKGMMTMKSILKRAAAGVLALAMCAGLAGCYSEGKAWAAKAGDDTMPIGGYIYYLTSAYTDASAKVDSNSEVFKSQIDGQDAQAWVEDRALGYLRSYYYVSQKFDQLGLTLTEEDQESIQSNAGTMWTYYKSAFEGMGVAEESFNKAYALYNTKLSRLLPAMYGQGGELEVSQDELKSYYLDNYTYYQYFSVPLTKTDDEGNPVDMEEDEKHTAKEMLENIVEQVNKGSYDFDKAAENYGTLSSSDAPTVEEPIAVQTASLSTLFSDTLTTLDNGKAALIDATSRYYVVLKLDVNDDFEALSADEDRTGSLLRTMKGDEFLEYVLEQAKGVDVQINQKAIASVRTSMVADTMGKNGTSSAESADNADGE